MARLNRDGKPIAKVLRYFDFGLLDLADRAVIFCMSINLSHQTVHLTLVFTVRFIL